MYTFEDVLKEEKMVLIIGYILSDFFCLILSFDFGGLERYYVLYLDGGSSVE